MCLPWVLPMLLLTQCSPLQSKKQWQCIKNVSAQADTPYLNSKLSALNSKQRKGAPRSGRAFAFRAYSSLLGSSSSSSLISMSKAAWQLGQVRSWLSSCTSSSPSRKYISFRVVISSSPRGGGPPWPACPPRRGRSRGPPRRSCS